MLRSTIVIMNYSTISEYQIYCQNAFALNDFIHISLLPAVLIIVFMTIIERPCKKQRCYCAPSCMVPVNLLDDWNESRFAYAAAFGSTATNILTYFSGGYLPDETPRWAAVFYAMASVVEMGVDYYPFFICLSSNRKTIGSCIGLAYATCWFLLNLAHIFECFSGDDLLFSGQPAVIQAPVLICLLYLIMTYIRNLVLSLIGCWSERQRSYPRLLSSSRPLNVSKLLQQHQIARVKYLLRSSFADDHPNSSSTRVTMIRRLCEDYICTSKFKFSSRVLTTFFVSSLCLYEFALLLFFSVEKGFVAAKELINQYKSHLQSFGAEQSAKVLLRTSWYCWNSAFALGSLLVIFYILQTFLAYSKHMQQLYKGNYSCLPSAEQMPDPSKLMSNSLSYSGIQIAYILWGHYVIVFTLFLIAMAISYLLILPLMGLVSNVWLEPAKALIPTMLVALLTNYLQVLLSRYVILQNHTVILKNGSSSKKTILALSHRKVFHIVTYFLFFFHILLGLFSCLLRILKGVIVGVIFLVRIDRPGLIKEFQTWDPGYMAYVSFLQVENAHCHPALVAFCDNLLQKPTNRTHIYQSSGETATSDLFPRVSRRAYNRWGKVYTLLRNPSLVEEKRHSLYARRQISTVHMNSRPI